MDKAKASSATNKSYTPKFATEMLNMKGKNERREGPDVPEELPERSTAEDGDEIAASVNQFSVRLLLQLLKRLGTPPARVFPPFFHPLFTTGSFAQRALSAWRRCRSPWRASCF